MQMPLLCVLTDGASELSLYYAKVSVVASRCRFLGVLDCGDLRRRCYQEGCSAQGVTVAYHVVPKSATLHSNPPRHANYLQIHLAASL